MALTCAVLIAGLTRPKTCVLSLYAILLQEMPVCILHE